MTITPDDILASSVFAEDREPEDERAGAGRALSGASDGPLDHPRRRRRLGGGQDDPHPRARARARRGQRHARLRRRLPPLRPPPARRAEHHAAPPRLQLHRHHGAAPRAHARRRAVPQAGLPAQGRHLRAARARRAQALLGRRGAARLLHRGAAAALRRADLPRPARGAPAALEGAARLLAARLHDRPGAERARPARARLGGLHPAPAALRRHRRLVPARTPAATRSTSTPSSSSARRCATPTSARCSTARPTRATASGSARRTARRTCTSRAGSSASAPR